MPPGAALIGLHRPEELIHCSIGAERGNLQVLGPSFPKQKFTSADAPTTLLRIPAIAYLRCSRLPALVVTSGGTVSVQGACRGVPF